MDLSFSFCFKILVSYIMHSLHLPSLVNTEHSGGRIYVLPVQVIHQSDLNLFSGEPHDSMFYLNFLKLLRKFFGNSIH